MKNKEALDLGWRRLTVHNTPDRYAVGHIGVDGLDVHTEYGETLFDTETARHLKDDLNEEEH